MKVLIKEKLSPNKYIDNSGYLICKDAVLARTGKQEYLKREIFPNSPDGDSIVEVDRKEEQVFADSTIASFENKPLTCEHPYENVTPENYREHSVGYVRDVHRGTYNGQDVLKGTLVVTDQSIIEDIQNGIRTELSCGYDCDITEEENPQQINIRGNHVALCEQGRAGIAKIIDSKMTRDANDYNAFLTKLGFQWLKKMASDREKWYFTGTQEEFLNAVNTIRKDREKLIESSSNDGSKTITIIKPSNLKKDSMPIKDEETFEVGDKFIDKRNNTWELKEIKEDNLIFDINGKINTFNKETFEEMLGKGINRILTLDAKARSMQLKDNYESKLVIIKKEDGKLAVITKEDFDSGTYKEIVEVPAKFDNVEKVVKFLMDQCDVPREDIVDATNTSNVEDTVSVTINENEINDEAIAKKELDELENMYSLFFIMVGEDFTQDTFENYKDAVIKANEMFTNNPSDQIEIIKYVWLNEESYDANDESIAYQEMWKNGEDIISPYMITKRIGDSTMGFGYDGNPRGNDYPIYIDKYRECIIYQLEDGTYTSKYLEEDYNGKDVDEVKEKLQNAIDKNIKNYSKDFEKKELDPVNPKTLGDAQGYSNHFYEELEKILNRKLKRYEKQTGDSIEIESDEYKQMYEEARKEVLEEINSQLEKIKNKKENK